MPKGPKISDGSMVKSGVQLTEATPIADVVASPASFENQVIRIEGFVVEVCQSQGCYVMLEDWLGNHLNLKVTDGVIDFRQTVEVGEYAVGEGVAQQAGEHGAQVFIEDHGAMIGTTVCAGYVE